MWWGGEDEDPPSGGSSSDNTTPPVDIMEDEASGLSPTSSSVISGDLEIPELKEQFAMQESLLGKLTSALKSNEEKLHLKEKEVQDYAIRLSKSKRSKMSSPMVRSADSVYTSSPVSVPETVSTGGGRISLLKKQLDEQRAKETEAGRSRQGLEEMVRQLQKDLQDREAVISQLHEQMSVASFRTSPLNSPFVMSPGAGSPSEERSPDRTPPLGCSVDSAASSFFGAHYQSFTDKDNKIIDLTEKNIDLERKLLDMEENLRAKDELIRARTAAVTLMSADLSAKGKSTLDQLEETRFEMRQMQSNFAEQESQWREKSSCLEVELINKDQRLKQLEESMNRTERARFELSTKNAELQEKIVGLQTQLSDVKNKREEESIAHFQFEEKMKDKITGLERTIEIAERTRNDRKAEFVESIKNLVEKEDVAEEILKLEQRLTELEEEKGNLQLKLVDCEDIASAESNLAFSLKAAQDQIRQLDNDLDSSKTQLISVQQENDDLTKAVNDRDTEIHELASKLENMLSSNEDLSLSRVKLEMKSVELEEQRDRLEEERQELVSNISESRKYTEETVKTLIEVQKAHSVLNKKYEALEIENGKFLNMQRIHDEDFLEKSELIKEQKIALSQLEKSLLEKTHEMSDLLVQADRQKAEIIAFNEKIEDLNQDLSNRDNEICELKSLLDENSVQEKFQEMNSKLEQSKLDFDNITTEKEGLIDQVLKHQNEKLQIEEKFHEIEEKLSLKEANEQEFGVTMTALNDKISNYEQEIQSLRSANDNREDFVIDLKAKLSSFSTELSSKNETIHEKSEQLEEQNQMILKKSQIIQDLENEMTNVKEEMDRKVIEILQEKEILENKLKLEIEDAESRRKEIESQMSYGTSELNDTIVKLKEEIIEKGHIIDGLQKDLQNKDNLKHQDVEALENQVKILEDEIANKNELINDFTEKFEFAEQEKNQLNEKLAALRNKAKEYLKKAKDLQSKNESLEEQLAEETSKQNVDEVANEQISVLQEMLKQKTLEFTELSEKFKQLEEEMSNNATASVENLKEEHESELQNYIEMCSGLNDQLSQLSESLAQNSQEKSDLQAMVDQLLVEKQSLETSAQNKEELIKLNAENSSRMSSLEARIEMVQTDNSNLIHEKDHLEDVKNQMASKFQELQNQLDSEVAANQETKSQLESSKMKLKSLQQNYDSLVSNQGDSQPLIQERDKAKAKCDLLTEKCKKLLVKCKKQEEVLKVQEIWGTELKDLKEKMEIAAAENVSLQQKHQELLEDFERKVQFSEEIQMGYQDLDETHEALKLEMSNLQNNFKKQHEEFSDLFEQKVREIDDLNENIRNGEDENQRLFDSNNALKTELADLQQRLEDTLGDNEKNEEISNMKQKLENLQSELHDANAFHDGIVQSNDEAIKTLQSKIGDFEDQILEKNEKIDTLKEELDALQMQLNDVNTSHETVIQDLRMKIDECQEIIEKSANKVTILEKDLSDQREELRTVTITKNNIIEENVTKIKTLQDQLLESSNINEQQNVNLTEKLADLNSTIEQCREQKLNDDMTVAQVNDTVKILKTQLSERDSEIVQLGIVIQQKDDDLKKVQELEEGIHKILGESQSCEAEKLKLQDQLDSLTIVAENLASLQQQVRLKDSEIERLNQELETARQEQHQLQLQLDQAAQVQQEHRPPPDVTQYQSAQPDIAAVRQPSVQQPDLMPGIGFQASPLDLVHDQAQGWDVDDWGEPDNAANWFENVPNNPPPQEPTAAAEFENVADNNEAVRIQQALDAKDEECSTLRSERDTLLNIQGVLQAQIETLNAQQVVLEDQIKELESKTSLMTSTAVAASPIQTSQLVQCQPQTNEKMTETVVEPENQVHISADNANVESPEMNQNVFNWGDNFTSDASSPPTDFFNQFNSPQSSGDRQTQSDWSMLEETRQSLDDHMAKLAKATEELDIKNHQLEIIQKEKNDADNLVLQLQTDLMNVEHELQQVKELKHKEIDELQQLVDHLKVKQVELESSPTDFFNQLNPLPEESSATNSDSLGLQQALDAKDEEISSLRAEREALFNSQGLLQSQIENLNRQQVVLEDQVKELESQLSMMTSTEAVSTLQTSQLVQCQPLTNEKMTETMLEPESQIQILADNTTSVESPEVTQNVFNWSDNFASDASFLPQQTSPTDFFNQFNAPQSSGDLQPQSDMTMLEETRRSLDDHMTRLAKATEELDVKNHQVEMIQKEKDEADNQISQLKTDMIELKHELEQVKEMKHNEINELQQLVDHLKVKPVDLESSPTDFFDQLNPQPAEQNVTPISDNLELQQALDAKEEEISSLRSERDTLLNVQGELKAQIENLNQTQVKNEDFEEQQNNTTGTNLAVPITQSVEKGLSASSYFDTLGASNINSEADNASDSNPFLETSVFETQAISEPSNSDLEWYKSQLEQYQQAISDWQTWSQGQLQESAAIQESLASYTTAYNALVEEHAKYTTESSTTGTASSNENPEVERLRASVKAKEMEIDDLIETVDRLKTEKSDLEQEITDLRVSTTQDLDSPAKFDFAMFEETRQSLDDHMDRLAKATDELDAKTRQIEIILEEKQMAEKQVGQLQNDLIELKHELEQVKENKDKEMDELQQLLDNLKFKHVELDAEIQSKEAEIEILKSKPDIESKDISLNTSIESEMEQLKAQIENQNSEIEQHTSVLNDWNIWGQAQTEALDAKTRQIETFLEEKLMTETQVGQLQNDLDELKHEFEQVKEDKQKEIDGLQQLVDDLKVKQIELEAEIQSKEVEIENFVVLKPDIESKDISLNTTSIESDTIEQLKSQIENQNSDLSNWKIWSEERTLELEAKTNEIQIIQGEKTELEKQSEMLQENLDDLKKELEQVTETKNKEILSFQEEINLLKESKAVDHDQNLGEEEKVENVDPPKEEGTTTTTSNEDIEKLMSEIEQQKSVLNDWNIWGQAKTEEYNQLLEAYNAYVESYTKLTEEITDLKTANENLNEIFTTTQASLQEKVSELNDKNIEIENFVKLNQQQQNESVIDASATAFDNDESKGWDAPEDEVLLGQSDQPNDNAVLELEAEISDLKQKLRTSEEAKSTLNDELTAAKVKHGKLTLKIKQLSKELQTRKSMTPESALGSAGGDSLDKAIQEELNQRAEKAEKSLKEIQQQCNEINKEKTKLLERIDTLEAGNSRFLELKESQDQDVHILKTQLKDLQGKVSGFEWQLSEKDSLIQDLEEQINLAKQMAGGDSTSSDEVSDQINLKLEINSLRRQITEMEASCSMLQRQVEELEQSLQSSKNENEDLASQLLETQDQMDNMSEEHERLKNVEVQYESLKLKLEHLESEKQQSSSSQDIYEDFQTTNQHMQQEILSLKTYIGQQQMVNATLQQQLQGVGGPIGQDQQLLATLVSERSRVNQLEQELQTKEATLMSVLKELDSVRSSSRERHSSMTSNDQEEIRNIFSDPENNTSGESDLLLQNQRLMYDLDKSIGERKMLSQQMENWKRQLTSTDEDELATVDDQDEDGSDNDPVFIRMKQEQAYRSVGALQLRVEELTLEVTKLLEERDTLQLKLSNVMRQFERHKDSASRASTACSTPIPWTASDSAIEVKELKHKIDELSKLNYSLDIELQKERGNREQMQAKLRLHSSGPKRMPQLQQRSTPDRDSPGPVLHI